MQHTHTRDPQLLGELERRACRVRLELIRMFSHGKAHHYGGSLSCVEIATALFFYRMRRSPDAPDDLLRDRFVMSKGHSVPVQYVILAMQGILSTEELATIKQLGSRLQGHPDVRKTPGLEAPTGSLGMGLSYANGIALAARMDRLEFDTYVLLGDGEMQEGQVWEAAMTTAHHGLTRVCAVVDRNRFQSQGEVDRIMAVEPLLERWRAFGWEAVRVDGHDLAELCGALDRMDGGGRERPLAVVADTIKGRGVSFMESTYRYHNAALTPDEYERAVREIESRLAELEEGETHGEA